MFTVVTEHGALVMFFPSVCERALKDMLERQLREGAAAAAHCLLQRI